VRTIVCKPKWESLAIAAAWARNSGNMEKRRKVWAYQRKRRPHCGGRRETVKRLAKVRNDSKGLLKAVDQNTRRDQNLVELTERQKRKGGRPVPFLLRN